MQALNAKTQQMEDVTFSVDKNKEIVCSFADGHFLKFPAGTSKQQIIDLLEVHNRENAGKEIITPEMEAAEAAEQAEAQALVDDLNS